MKKIITVIAFLLIGLTTYSQNLLGQSYRDVKKAMDEKGFIIKEGYKDDVYRIIAHDNYESKIYYFRKDNTCYAYKSCYYGRTYSELESVLLNVGYTKISSSIYTSDMYQAEIELLEKGKQYFVTITFK